MEDRSFIPPGRDIVYRKRRDGSVWHFSEDCSSWPTVDFIESSIPLDLLESICQECMSRYRVDSTRAREMS
ncbi:MAG TPA: hypothetical protein VNN77_01495 [candidate division Zixibacteria bacterium]|nr:hypothetical protein [candidate division Zixibacteria bacterium]